MKARGLMGVASALMGLVLCAVAPADWPQYAGDAARGGMAAAGPENVAALLWRSATNGDGQPIGFEGPSSPVVAFGRVYVNARHFSGGNHTHNKIVAFDQSTGEWLFETLVERAVLESWSSPAVDVVNEVVLLGTGNKLTAVDAFSGTIRWTTTLTRSVVNASPAVIADAIRGRVFITDYHPFGTQGRLYCINSSPFDASDNPYAPGQIVWEEIIGATSGATPACADDHVYVATADGVVFAFVADAPPGSRLLWSTFIGGEGFFGGVGAAGGYVYAAGYDFWDTAPLVKIRADDGAVMWTVECERTASIPIVHGDLVLLSAGLPGFGSVPTVQAFRDDGNAATRLWDTYDDSGGTLIVGGWTHQPALVGDVLYVGTIPLSGFGPYTDLYLLDLTRTPGQSGFIREHRPGVGSSPALCGGRLYSIGATGLHALAARGDFSGDGIVTGDDIQGFSTALIGGAPNAQEIALADFNGNDLLDESDTAHFIDKLLGRSEP